MRKSGKSENLRELGQGICRESELEPGRLENWNWSIYGLAHLEMCHFELGETQTDNRGSGKCNSGDGEQWMLENVNWTLENWSIWRFRQCDLAIWVLVAWPICLNFPHLYISKYPGAPT
jgi:hypothetical protein